MRRSRAALTALVVAAVLAGCGSGDSGGPIACTTEARASVTVSTVDAAGAPLGGATVTRRVDGGPAAPADCVDGDQAAGGCTRFVAGWEVPGTIVVEAAKPGMRTASATVVVEMDDVGCHVVGREIELRLLRN